MNHTPSTQAVQERLRLLVCRHCAWAKPRDGPIDRRTPRAAGSIDPRPLITHRFALSEMQQAYEAFGHAAREKAIKALISAL
jgi:hypothetical protein